MILTGAGLISTKFDQIVTCRIESEYSTFQNVWKFIISKIEYIICMLASIVVKIEFINKNCEIF